MKKFKITLIIFISLVVIIIASAYIYFNDARLKSIILPIASEALGTQVTADNMSLSLFRNFPSIGVRAEGVRLVNDKDNPLEELESAHIAVRLFPMLSNKLDISRLELNKAKVLYVVYPDSSTNIDQMMNALSDTAGVDPDAKPWEVDLKHLVLNEASITYRSAPDTMDVTLNRMNLDASIQITEVINSTFDALFDGLSVSKGGRSVVSGVSFGLEQQSIIDLTNEMVSLQAGDLKFGDFALGLTGTLTSWSESLNVNLTIASSSSDFAEILNVLPADIRSQFANYETNGSFRINGTIVGLVTDTSWPQFDLTANIKDGYLKDRSLPTAIENINLDFTATNERIEILDLRATAGLNSLVADGVITNPLEQDISDVSLNLKASLDLATVSDFYDMSVHGVEQMSGTMQADADIEGRIKDLANGKFDADLKLQNGYLKYKDVVRPIEDLFVVLTATRERLDISDFRAKAGDNKVDLSGVVLQPLDTNRTSFDLNFDVFTDLATIKEFYPISEDTLAMRGIFTAKGDAKGTYRDIENSVINSSVSLKDGFIAYKAFGDKPIEDIQIQAAGSAKSVVFEQFRAVAGVNRLAFTGTITEPLNESRTAFNVNADVYLDLATVKDYYPIGADTLQMSGILTTKSQLQGRVNDLDNVLANGSIGLQNGRLFYSSIAPKAFEDIQIKGTIVNQRIQFDQASLRAGTNTINASGSVSNYLGDNPISDVTVRTTFNLAEARDYATFDPELKSLQGQAVSNLTLKGPIMHFDDLRFVGTLDLNNVSIAHDSLPKPITNLQAKMNFSEQQATLNQMVFKIGASDIDINGSISRYMALVSDEPNTTPAELIGNFKSTFLNVDEIYPMSGSESEVSLILPNLNSRLSAQIDSMIVFASPVTNLNTTIETSPKQIFMRDGSFNLFGGSIRGVITFDVLNPKQSILDFVGQLSDIRIESFFQDFPVFGQKTNIHKYLSGGINFDTDYKTALDSYLHPETPTTQSEGSFGMTAVRFRNHPIQIKIADFLKIPELKDIGLDAWTANYKIGQSLLTLQDMKITSKDIGLELEGVENLRNDEIAYQTRVYLPRRLTTAIAGVLPAEAVQALVRPDSTILVPLLITGTANNPQVALNQEVVKSIVDEYIRNKVGTLEDAARERLQNLFRRNQDD